MYLKCKLHLSPVSFWPVLIAEEDRSWNCWVLNTNGIMWFCVVSFFILGWGELFLMEIPFIYFQKHPEKKWLTLIWARNGLCVVGFGLWSLMEACITWKMRKLCGTDPKAGFSISRRQRRPSEGMALGGSRGSRLHKWRWWKAYLCVV